MPLSNKPTVDLSLPEPLQLGSKPSSSSSVPGLALSPTYPPSPSHELSARQHRSSLPGPDAYAGLIQKDNFDEFLQKYLVDQDGNMTTPINLSSKQRTQYYEDQLQYKGNATCSARERVQRESPVVADLRTNVIIKDEFTLVTDLSHHLAARYTRPDSAVMVKVDHSACLAMGGTFDPCYILTITTVPSQMGPTMNKRNAALIQSFMADILSVPPERGILKFSPVPEENFATNGTTILGEIERQEKQQSAESGGSVRRAVNSMGRRSVNAKKSLPRMGSEDKTQDSNPVTDHQLQKSKPSTPRADSAAPSSVSEDQVETPTTATITNSGQRFEVFELPATEMEKKRSAPPTLQSSTSNGLRMNGVSSDELGIQAQRRSSKEKRRTISGETPVQTQLENNPIVAPPTARPGAISQTRPHSFLKYDPNTLQTVCSGPNPTRRHSAVPMQDRSLDAGGMGSMHGDWTMMDKSGGDKKDAKPRGKKDEKKDQEANTAKRRSTINAAPKKVDGRQTPTRPDPVDAKSAKSLKVGKRKSFLSAFRRTSASP